MIGYNGADVSSTKIRVLAGAGMDLTSFLPEKIAAYIQKKGLYEISGANTALALEKPERAAHSLRVAELAALRAVSLKISEKKAIAAALFHDCAKNLSPNAPRSLRKLSCRKALSSIALTGTAKKITSASRRLRRKSPNKLPREHARLSVS